MVESTASAKTDETIKSYTEQELENLGNFFIESVHQLLGLNKDLINRELHPNGTNEILNNFASDSNRRTIVFSKIEKAADSEELKNSDPQEKKEAVTVKLLISDKVEYQGVAAQTVAFLKREPFKLLSLKDKSSIEEKSPTPTGEAAEIEEEYVDLSA